MVIKHSFLILPVLLRVASVDANGSGRYVLYPNKAFVETCGREIWSLHPGMIEKVHTRHWHKNYWAECQIEARDGPEWFVLCDLSTGKISRERKRVDEAGQ